MRLDLAPTRSAPAATPASEGPGLTLGAGIVQERTRAGTCHRCGWRREISRVARADRRVPQIGFSYARLCQECRGELAGLDVRGPDVPRQRWARRRAL
jgi:hypothetical protein